MDSNEFSNEKYSRLYIGKSYREFLSELLAELRNGNAPQYTEFNYPISEWATKHSIDPIMAIDGWFQWIDAFRKDSGVFALNSLTYDVRKKADEKLREFVKRLVTHGDLINATDIEKLSESVFVKASVDNLLDFVYKK